MTKPQPTPGETADATDVAYRLVLFVAGDGRHSRAARRNLAEVCDREDVKCCCDVEVVDVLEDFDAAARHSILVTPTLLVVEPAPETVIVGDLSDHHKVLAALQLESM